MGNTITGKIPKEWDWMDLTERQNFISTKVTQWIINNHREWFIRPHNHHSLQIFINVFDWSRYITNSIEIYQKMKRNKIKIIAFTKKTQEKSDKYFSVTYWLIVYVCMSELRIMSTVYYLRSRLEIYLYT